MTMKLGSYEHKKLFCRMLIDTHTADKPRHFPWPNLDDDSLARLQSISLWSKLLHHQQESAQILSVFTDAVRDPLMKEAIALLANEQNQQANALASMMNLYGLTTLTGSSIKTPNKPETAFINLGFQNCLDSFLGFGLFGIAQQAYYLPESLLECFNTVLDEKARHTVFFINWWAYWNLKLKQKRDWSELRGVNALWARRRDLLRLITAFDQEDFEEHSSDAQLSAGRLIGNLTLDQFLNTCCLEQNKRMQNFDSGLLKPQLPTNMAQWTQRILKFWPQRVGN